MPAATPPRSRMTPAARATRRRVRPGDDFLASLRRGSLDDDLICRPPGRRLLGLPPGGLLPRRRPRSPGRLLPPGRPGRRLPGVLALRILRTGGRPGRGGQAVGHPGPQAGLAAGPPSGSRRRSRRDHIPGHRGLVGWGLVRWGLLCGSLHLGSPGPRALHLRGLRLRALRLRTLLHGSLRLRGLLHGGLRSRLVRRLHRGRDRPAVRRRNLLVRALRRQRLTRRGYPNHGNGLGRLPGRVLQGAHHRHRLGLRRIPAMTRGRLPPGQFSRRTGLRAGRLPPGQFSRRTGPRRQPANQAAHQPAKRAPRSRPRPRRRRPCPGHPSRWASAPGLVPHLRGESRGRWKPSPAWPSRPGHPRSCPAAPARAGHLGPGPSCPCSGPSSRGSGRSVAAGAVARVARRAARPAARRVPGPAPPGVVPPLQRRAPAPGRKQAGRAGRPGPAAAARRSSPAPGAAARAMHRPRPGLAGPPLTPSRPVPQPARLRSVLPLPVRAWRR